jgi:LuxR family maltose regulon positive regulatory protein
MIREAVDLLALGIPAWLKPEFAAHLARFYLDQGNPAAAEAVIKQLGIALPEGLVLSEPALLPETLTFPDGLKSILSLRLLLTQVRAGHRLAEIQTGIILAGFLVSRTPPSQGIEILLPALLLRAQLAAVHGNIEGSLADLCRAVEIAEAEGYIRIFLDEGSAIAESLKLSLERPVQPNERQANFIRQVLAAFCDTELVPRPEESAIRSSSLGTIGMLIEPLTDREMDVLRLMAEGLKYQEIAERLFITVNTVRFYVKEIYSKLNVNNRTQAIRTAHELKLL